MKFPNLLTIVTITSLQHPSNYPPEKTSIFFHGFEAQPSCRCRARCGGSWIPCREMEQMDITKNIQEWCDGLKNEYILIYIFICISVYVFNYRYIPASILWCFFGHWNFTEFTFLPWIFDELIPKNTPEIYIFQSPSFLVSFGGWKSYLIAGLQRNGGWRHDKKCKLW